MGDNCRYQFCDALYFSGVFNMHVCQFWCMQNEAAELGANQLGLVPLDAFNN
jgi:hypothetical protein